MSQSEFTNGQISRANPNVLPLCQRQVGDRLRIVALDCGEANSRLMGMGLMPDVELEVMSQTSTGATIVAIADQRLGLGEDMGRGIMTIAIGQSTDRALVTLKLRDAAIGANLQVVGYEPTGREYKRKLLAMGLTPGTQLQVKRFAPLGDPTEIEVRGFRLSLRKHEADALIVTTI